MLRDRKFLIEFVYNPTQFYSLHLFKQNILNRPSQLNVLVSSQEGNKLYQGTYYETAIRDTSVSLISQLRDFRKIVAFEKINNDRNFVQVESLSYILGPVAPNQAKIELQPWDGINGICEFHQKISLAEITDVILCFYERKLFLKYYSLKKNEEVITREMRMSEEVAGSVQDSSAEILAILSQGFATEHIVIIYKLKGKLLYLLTQITGDL